MPRGGMKVGKPAKVTQIDAPVALPSKPSRRNSDWMASISKPTFLSRNSSETKLAASVPTQFPVPTQPQISMQSAVPTPSPAPTQFPVEPRLAEDIQMPVPDLTADSTHSLTDLESVEARDATPSTLPNELESLLRPTLCRNVSSQSTLRADTDDATSDKFEDLTIQENQSSVSSTFSKDRSSIYSRDSASIYSTASMYSSASSICSSGASMYSLDEEIDIASDARVAGKIQTQRTRSIAAKRPEPQDAAARERSTLARKAALFKNSRLRPDLPTFHTTLPNWSMVCRAILASNDCYDSELLTRRGTYTPADSSKDIKAMILDEQFIDNTRVVIVSIRGTQFQSLSDWVVNKNAIPTRPVGFLDDLENGCHEGFLLVARAMVAQVAAQLQQHPASSERPSLLFTGHSAGGAVAALLYSHMLSTKVPSELTALASLFPSINCVTFGSPPLAVAPLPTPAHGNGVFLTFVNEGDPVSRLGNMAYLKSIAKMMTAAPPLSAAVPPPVKVIRGSRGTRVIRQTAPVAPQVPWAELPLWPTPGAPLTNPGDVILLRDSENGSATASLAKDNDLKEVIFTDLLQHTVDQYLRRVKEVSFDAMMGRV